MYTFVMSAEIGWGGKGNFESEYLLLLNSDSRFQTSDF